MALCKKNFISYRFMRLTKVQVIASSLICSSAKGTRISVFTSPKSKSTNYQFYEKRVAFCEQKAQHHPKAHSVAHCRPRCVDV